MYSGLVKAIIFAVLGLALQSCTLLHKSNDSECNGTLKSHSLTLGYIDNVVDVIGNEALTRIDKAYQVGGLVSRQALTSDNVARLLYVCGEEGKLESDNISAHTDFDNIVNLLDSVFSQEHTLNKGHEISPNPTQEDLSDALKAVVSEEFNALYNEDNCRLTECGLLTENRSKIKAWLLRRISIAGDVKDYSGGSEYRNKTFYYTLKDIDKTLFVAHKVTGQSEYFNVDNDNNLNNAKKNALYRLIDDISSNTDIDVSYVTEFIGDGNFNNLLDGDEKKCQPSSSSAFCRIYDGWVIPVILFSNSPTFSSDMSTGEVEDNRFKLSIDEVNRLYVNRKFEKAYKGYVALNGEGSSFSTAMVADMLYLGLANDRVDYDQAFNLVKSEVSKGKHHWFNEYLFGKFLYHGFGTPKEQGRGKKHLLGLLPRLKKVIASKPQDSLEYYLALYAYVWIVLAEKHDIKNNQLVNEYLLLAEKVYPAAALHYMICIDAGKYCHGSSTEDVIRYAERSLDNAYKDVPAIENFLAGRYRHRGFQQSKYVDLYRNASRSGLVNGIRNFGESIIDDWDRNKRCSSFNEYYDEWKYDANEATRSGVYGGVSMNTIKKIKETMIHLRKISITTCN